MGKYWKKWASLPQTRPFFPSSSCPNNSLNNSTRMTRRPIFTTTGKALRTTTASSTRTTTPLQLAMNCGKVSSDREMTPTKIRSENIYKNATFCELSSSALIPPGWALPIELFNTFKTSVPRDQLWWLAYLSRNRRNTIANVFYLWLGKWHHR